MWARNLGRLLTLCACVALVSTAWAADRAPATLKLAVGDVNPATLIDIRQQAPAEEPTHVVVQFDGPLTAQRRAELADLGVTLGDYLPPNSYIVDMRQRGTDALTTLSEVAWVGAYDDGWKLALGIRERQYYTAERQQLADAGLIRVDVTLFEGADDAAALAAVANLADATVHMADVIAGNVMLTVTLPQASLASLATIDEVQFVEETPEVTLRNSTNRWIVQSNISNVTPLYDAGIHGENQVIGIMDGRIWVDHCSFDDTAPIGPTHRKILAYNASTGADSHGTHVAGTACGDNGVNDDTRGVAYLAKLVFDTIPSFTESAMYGQLETHHNQGARVHTNSWGDDGTTAYNSLCRGIDSFCYDYETSMVCLAVTNTSTLRNPENAKNLLAVGASQDSPLQDNHCSGGTGPTSDGRRKPEIYAPGCGTNSSSSSASCGTRSLTGTSMASPAIGGTGLLVRQYYTDGYYPTGLPTPGDGFEPSGALIKATLLNSAENMIGVSGYPSDVEGWGRVKADDALHFAGENRKMIVYDTLNADGLSTGEVDEYQFEMLSGDEGLRVTLVWTEPPATAGAAIAYINNLDLEVVRPSGTVYLGNVFTGGVSEAGGSADIRNNVEQVKRNVPDAGTWTIRVKGTAVNQGTQGYALVIVGDVLPDLPPFSISLPNGAPEVLAPGVPADFDVLITPGDENIVPGSEVLMVRYDGGIYQSTPLAAQGGNLYTATLPAASCDDTPEFFVMAEGDGGTTRMLPDGAPTNVLTAIVGEETTPFEFDFEAAGGWTVGAGDDDATTGIWNRMDPQATEAQPEDDHSASGTQCWVTDGLAGTSLGDRDIDGGKTTLFSPTLDLSTAVDPTISYWRWYSNTTGASPNADVFVVDVSDNDGGSWVNVETVGPTGEGTSGGWFYHEFRVADLVNPTSQVKLRFIASDEGSGSIVEAALDDFRVDDFGCEDVPSCDGDLDGDFDIDFDDLNLLLAAYDTCSGDAGYDPAADLDSSGCVGFDDLNLLLAVYGASCP